MPAENEIVAPAPVLIPGAEMTPPAPVRVVERDAAPRIEEKPVLALVDELLRDRRAVLDRIDAGVDLQTFARAMIVTIGVSAAAFGGAIGASRGGVQIALAAIKLPIVVLLTAALCAPAATALNIAFERRADLRRDLSRVLASLALGALVLAGLTPLLLLGVVAGAGYHAFILAIVGACLAGGLAGVIFLIWALASERKGAFPVIVTLLAVFALVGTQMAWVGRPWVTRPKTTGVVLLRNLDSESFLDSVMRSVDSAAGIYSRDEAPLSSSDPTHVPIAPDDPPAWGMDR